MSDDPLIISETTGRDEIVEQRVEPNIRRAAGVIHRRAASPGINCWERLSRAHKPDSLSQGQYSDETLAYVCLTLTMFPQ